MNLHFIEIASLNLSPLKIYKNVDVHGEKENNRLKLSCFHHDP